MPAANDPYTAAVAALLDEFRWNPWFLETYWPENAERVKSIVELASNATLRGTSEQPTVLEVGCANGYIACLFNELGFRASAIDSYDEAVREAMFARRDIAFTKGNLNDAPPLTSFADNSMSVVVLGEVFEHILNHPAGLLQAVYRILRPGGAVILTTPNPSTLANSIRLLGDGYVLWGTPSFLREVKLQGTTVIDRGDIHYREYPAWIVTVLMKELGYRIESVQYYRAAIAPTHSTAKKAVKTALALSGLSKTRPFALGYIIEARKPS
jgi:2-polyprenyl-3-methyl-5-hydroxy-6-metoxy-1,4-benzoquinol methylase